AWNAALNGGPAVDFELAAIPIIELLSASPIRFDAAGNLFVGGSDAFDATTPEGNFFGLVRAADVLVARAGGGLINTADPTKVRKFDPSHEAEADSFYYVQPNVERSEVYAVDFASDTVFVFGVSAPVPALPPWGLASAAMLIGLLGWRLRR